MTISPPIINEFSQESLSNILASEHVTQELVDKVNLLAVDDELAEAFKENLTTYTTVLTKGSFSQAQYVSAVQYVSYRLMGHKVVDAWAKTFPDRYAKLLSDGVNSKGISSHASAYNKTKLVNLITEQSLIPSYIINNGYFQEALNKQISIMNNEEASFKVQSDAAHRVMEYTAIPDSLLADTDELSEKSIDIITMLAKAASDLASTQQNSIRNKTSTTKQIAEGVLYDEEGEIINE